MNIKITQTVKITVPAKLIEAENLKILENLKESGVVAKFTWQISGKFAILTLINEVYKW
jgi:hypothetical protein